MKYLWMLPLATLWGGVLALMIRSQLFRDEAWDIVTVALVVTVIALLTRWL